MNDAIGWNRTFEVARTSQHIYTKTQQHINRWSASRDYFRSCPTMTVWASGDYFGNQSGLAETTVESDWDDDIRYLAETVKGVTSAREERLGAQKNGGLKCTITELCFKSLKALSAIGTLISSFARSASRTVQLVVVFLCVSLSGLIAFTIFVQDGSTADPAKTSVIQHKIQPSTCVSLFLCWILNNTCGS